MRTKPAAKPKLGPLLAVIDAILEADRTAPVKQRHTAKRIFAGAPFVERLRDNRALASALGTITAAVDRPSRFALHDLALARHRRRGAHGKLFTNHILIRSSEPADVPADPGSAQARFRILARAAGCVLTIVLYMGIGALLARWDIRL